ncbi:MAG: hypothetical protein A3H98_02920 [Bacteroidetes bacterium RIFCSPLOWO2_02_FULL_36_8]|nr:MAG: hypothetical protein A3H98_02920 [Bacteroidetes bacterium RIFCSPLOWO2_02_FULL_36_8]OFY72229.1 MAG: hypothetical protein A3G23_01530 [Bacteroidetes bacterium RIFCSPLOWO2_12_FULL_37_12]
MKNLFFLIAFILSLNVEAQSPYKMNYQTLVRNVNGILVQGTSVGVKASILQSTPSGTVVYAETHTSTTNESGLISLEIGGGTTTDNFSTIKWENGPFFLKVEIDPDGSTNYTVNIVSQLLSVPYALYAKNSGNVYPEGDVRNYGTIVFGSGATADEKIANTATIQAAINSVTGSGERLLIPRGDIYLTGTINVNKDRIHFSGSGVYATTLYSEAGVVFNFDKGPGLTLFQCSIKDISFYGSSSAQKIAIKVTDVDVMDINNISVGSWNGNTSIGIQYRGRDILTISKSTIFADRPISIEDNPNDLIDIDQAHFTDLYLGADEGPATSEACVRIASGINLTNVTFDGFHAWVLGKYGLYWNDNTSAQASLNFNLRNIRWEQSSSTAEGYVIYINHNYSMQNLIIDNVFGASNQEDIQSTNGIYLHNVRGGIISNSMLLAGTLGAPRNTYALDSTTYPIIVSNVFWSNTGGVRSIGQGLSPKVLMIRDEQDGVNYAVYDRVKSNSGTIVESPQTSSKVSLDNGSVTSINNGSMVYGVIVVNTSGGPSAMYSLRGSISTLEMSDPDGWFTPAKDTPGQINIYWSSTNSRYELQNLLGSTLKFSFFIMGTESW